MPTVYHLDSNGWSDAAKVYAAQASTMTITAADRLIEIAHSIQPFSSESYVLDNGAGNGALTVALISRFPNAKALAADAAPGMISILKERAIPNVETKVMDACVENAPNGLKNESFSHVLSTFMVQFVPQPMSVVREMYRTCTPGGMIGLGIWGEMDVKHAWDDACMELDPEGYTPHNSFAEGGWETAEEVESALIEAGFRDIQTEKFHAAWHFQSAEQFADFWIGCGNPGIMKMQSGWKGNLREVRDTMIRVVNEKYGGGNKFVMQAFLMVGRK